MENEIKDSRRSLSHIKRNAHEPTINLWIFKREGCLSPMTMKVISAMFR